MAQPAAPLQNAFDVVTSCFNTCFPADKEKLTDLPQRCEQASHLLIGHYVCNRFPPTWWEEVRTAGLVLLEKRNIAPITWQHTMARAIAMVAEAALNAEARASFRPISVRLPGGTEEILSASVVKQIFGWDDDVQQVAIDLTVFPPTLAPILLAYMRGEPLTGHFGAADLAIALEQAGQWRSLPLEKALLTAWIGALHPKGENGAVDICDGFERLTHAEQPLQHSDEQLWALIESCIVQQKNKAFVFQGLAKTVHQAGHLAIPPTSLSFPVVLLGPAEQKVVISQYGLKERLSTSLDPQVMSTFTDGGIDMTDLPSRAFTNLCNHLHFLTSSVAGDLPQLQQLLILADKLGATPLKQALTASCMDNLVHELPIMRWASIVEAIAAIVPLLDEEDRPSFVCSSLRALPLTAVLMFNDEASSAQIEHIIVERILRKQPPPFANALFALLVEGYPLLDKRAEWDSTDQLPQHPADPRYQGKWLITTSARQRYNLLFGALKQCLPDLKIEAYEASARQEGMVHLLPFLQHCFCTQKRETNEWLFGLKNMWAFLSKERDQFEPSLRSLLLTMNSTLMQWGEIPKDPALMKGVSQYYTADHFQCITIPKFFEEGLIYRPTCGPSMQAFREFDCAIEELRAALSANRLPTWTGRPSTTVPTEYERTAMGLLAQILDGSTTSMQGSYEQLLTSLHLPPILDALGSLVSSTNCPDIVIRVMHFYATVAPVSQQLMDSLRAPYEQLLILVPPKRWYEVDSRLRIIN